jgi:phosphomannomutase
MELRAQAEAWLAADPDPATRAELADLIARQDVAELADRFAGPLEFGTAGLRGRLGAGPNRMNRAVVIRAAAGLAAYLRTRQVTDGGVVVGYDARHLSRRFAEDSAAVFAAAGLRARLLPRPLPTPVLAFAVRHLGAAAGVMVTASHNPPGDNGYKVYLGDGRQIAPPADADIAAHIAAVGAAAAVPREEARVETLDDVVGRAYALRAAALVGEGPRGLRVAYTPLHGVGLDTLLDVLAAAGFAAPIVVREQAEPDPDFPTVAFPNPEEPGALDLVLALAADQDVDLVLANDPDADRCAAAVPTPAGPRRLTGDEVGALLAEHLASTGRATGTLATTIVSSTLLEKIAAEHGLGFARTLTGFKWLTRTPDLAYAYEEALGYCVDPGAVCDKDGLTAALLLAELAADCAARGRTLLDRLDDLARRHGVHATGALTVRVEDPAVIAAAMDRLRAEPPANLGGRVVERVDDLRRPTDGLPPTEGVRLVLAGRARVVVRPSGTEPKLKCYLEVVVPPEPDLVAARGRADADLRRIRQDLAAALQVPRT